MPDRCPPNQLHEAAGRGNERMVLAQLAKGSHIDQGTPNGCTALLIAAGEGHLRVVRTLLKKGANVSVPADGGGTALHASSQQGHLAVVIELVKAGADLGQKDSQGKTPLHVAADGGHWGVMRVLIETGANVNSRAFDGSTPLYSVAWQGNIDGIKVLLRKKADPLLRRTQPESGRSSVPLDAAALNGHCEAVRELVQQLGIKRCGGATGGVQALEVAAEINRTDIMGVLTDAGVVDTGMALVVAAEFCHEASVKFLLEQFQGGGGHGGSGYVNHRGQTGRTALFNAIVFSRPSPRIVRLLVDAGADMVSALRVLDTGGRVSNDTPLELASDILRENEIEGKDATEERRHRLEAIRRLLLRLEAVHAVSWLWSGDPHLNAHTAGQRASTTKAPSPSMPLVSMLPVLRRRASRNGVALMPLFR